MSTSNHILVPLGFSEQSKIALTQATHFAKVTKAKITLLSVIGENSSIKEALNIKDKNKDLKKKVEEELNKIVDKITVKEKQELHISTLISKGKVYEEIIKVAEMINAKMIIMGTDGKPMGIKKKVIGTNAYRVVTMSTCPVITIGGTSHQKGCKNIVVPLDLKKETKQKVSIAIRLAKFYNSNIHVLSVLKSTDQFLTNRLKRNLIQVEKFISEEKIICTSELIKPKKGQSLSDVVLAFSDKKKADLIAIMTQEESNITKYFLGSAAQAIIYNSKIPVISIQPKATTKTVHELPVF